MHKAEKCAKVWNVVSFDICTVTCLNHVLFKYIISLNILILFIVKAFKNLFLWVLK